MVRADSASTPFSGGRCGERAM